MSADATITNTGVVTIANSAVTYAKMQNGTGLSVLGVTGTSAAVHADITGTADQILRISPLAADLVFGAIDLSKSAAVGASILNPENGGTGIANAGSSTITLGGALTTSGAFATTLTSTAATSVTLPTTGILSTRDGVETLTNKRINSRVTSIVSSATPTPNVANEDLFVITALAETATFGAPLGTPVDGQKLAIRIRSIGAQSLFFDPIYRAGTDIVLPVTSSTGKTMYIGFIYNSDSSTWDLLALLKGF
jgi:hypothetical protein